MTCFNYFRRPSKYGQSSSRHSLFRLLNSHPKCSSSGRLMPSSFFKKSTAVVSARKESLLQQRGPPSSAIARRLSEVMRFARRHSVRERGVAPVTRLTKIPVPSPAVATKPAGTSFHLFCSLAGLRHHFSLLFLWPASCVAVGLPLLWREDTGKVSALGPLNRLALPTQGLLLLGRTDVPAL